MLTRSYELGEEVKTFLVSHNKDEVLITINVPEFQAHLSYLAVIFEAQNEMNRKLGNIIHHADILKSRQMQDGNAAQFE